MGLNIHVYKVVEKSLEETWGCHIVPFYKTETPKWWDCARFSGDREFASENEFMWFGGEYDEDELKRPVNIDKCIAWINENIQEYNRPRLLEAMEEFKKDENLAFHFSY